MASHPLAIVLRVPVLYGPTTDLGESAVTTLAKSLLSRAPFSVDDWQVRVPTFTPDIAATCLLLAEAARAPGGPAGVFHFSAAQRFTRWSLVQAFAEILKVDTAQVTRIQGPPPGAPRPFDCALECGKLQALGLAAPCTPFLEGARAVLSEAGALAEGGAVSEGALGGG